MIKKLVEGIARSVMTERAVQMLKADKDQQYIVFVQDDATSKSIISTIQHHFDADHTPRVVVVTAKDAVVIQMGKTDSP